MGGGPGGACVDKHPQKDNAFRIPVVTVSMSLLVSFCSVVKFVCVSQSSYHGVGGDGRQPTYKPCKK